MSSFTSAVLVDELIASDDTLAIDCSNSRLTSDRIPCSSSLLSVT